MTASTHGYCTVAELLTYMGRTSTSGNAQLATVIEAVSRSIDNLAGRRFYSVSETRYYTPVQPRKLFTDDILSISTLGTDSDGDRTYENTWANTDYDLEPYNAIADGKPYTRVEVSQNGNYEFPTNVKKSVRISGRFGFNTYHTDPPYPIKQATLIQSQRIALRPDAPFGVVGSAEMGITALVKLDPDVEMMVMPLRRVI